MEYYQGTFAISDIQVISNSEQKSSNNLKDLQEMNENLVSQINLSYHRIWQEFCRPLIFIPEIIIFRPSHQQHLITF